MKEFIERHFADSGDRYRSVYEAKMVDAMKNINLANRVKRFAALFCGNLLAMLQLYKEEKIPMLVISYHELKVSKNSSINLNHCTIFFVFAIFLGKRPYS